MAADRERKRAAGARLISLTGAVILMAVCPGLYCLDAQGQRTSGNTTLKGRIERDVAMADQLMLKGRYSDAADLYRQALKRNPKNVSVLIGLGLSLTRQFKLDGAEEQFDKALSIDANSALAHSGKATILLSRLQSSSATILRNKESILKQAEEECRKALSIDSGLADAHLALGLVLKDQGLLDEAARELSEALKLDPKSSEALVSLGMVKMAQGALAEAKEYFQQSLALNPSSSAARYGLGRVYLKQGLVDEAIKQLTTSLYQYPNSAPVHEALGAAYELQGNNLAAVREYQESIRIKPENPLAYVRIAQIRQNRGDLEHSIAELRSGLELMPDNPDLHLWVANQSMQLGKVEAAIMEYGTVLSLEPGHKEAAQGLARAYTLKAQRQAATAFLLSGQFEKASAMIDQALQLYPDDLALRLAAAKIRILAGLPVNLRTIGAPKSEAERLAYAEALMAQGNFQEAFQQMNKVITSLTEEKQLLAVADLALMIKDLDSAEKAYAKAQTSASAEERARRGLSAAAANRKRAGEQVHLADDLFSRRQYGSAVDRYRAAIVENPRAAAARLGLARALEKMSALSERDLRESAKQYRAYLALASDLTAKQRLKLGRRLELLEARATRLAQKDRDRAQK